jgi:hypothetical protein
MCARVYVAIVTLKTVTRNTANLWTNFYSTDLGASLERLPIYQSTSISLFPVSLLINEE